MPTNNADQLRREDCRREVRRYLAERPALAFAPAAIARKLRNDGNDFTEKEIEEAAEFLKDLSPPQVKCQHEALGSTQYFQITSAGILAHERS